MDYWYWLALSGATAALVLTVVLVVLIRRRHRSDLGRSVRAVAIDSVNDVLLPNGMGGQIQVEYLLLTTEGVVVVDVKHFEGTIFGSDRMSEWTVMGESGRFTFPNPQDTLYDRMAAVRRIVRDIPVYGHVVFPARADFSKGRPREVLLAEEFAERYRKPEKPEVQRVREELEPYWARITDTAEPARRK